MIPNRPDSWYPGARVGEGEQPGQRKVGDYDAQADGQKFVRLHVPGHGEVYEEEADRYHDGLARPQCAEACRAKEIE